MFGFLFGILVGAGLSMLFGGDEMNGVMYCGAIGIGAGLMSIFIDFLIQPGQIFGFWTKFLERVVNHRMNPLKALYKPLGGCLYCMNVWVAFAMFGVVYQFTDIHWLFILPTAAVSHVVVSIVEPIVNG